MMSNSVSESEKEIPTGYVSFCTQWFDVCVCIRVRGLHLVFCLLVDDLQSRVTSIGKDLSALWGGFSGLGNTGTPSQYHEFGLGSNKQNTATSK